MAYGDDIFARQMEARKLYGTGLGDLAPYINKSTDIMAQGFQEAQKQPLATAQLEAELYGKTKDREMAQQKLAQELEMAKLQKNLAAQGREETKRHNLEMEALSASGQGRLQEKDVRLSANKINDELKKLDKDYTEISSSLKNGLEAFKQNPTSSATRMLAIASARAAGEKGPLSDTDLAAMNLQSLPKDALTFSNYLMANADAIDANSPMAKDLIRVAEHMLKNSEQKKKTFLSNAYEQSLRVNPDVVVHPKYGPGIKEIGKKYGYEDVAVDPTGVVNFKKKAPVDWASKLDPEHQAQLAEWINQGRDPELARAKFQKAGLL